MRARARTAGRHAAAAHTSHWTTFVLPRAALNYPRYKVIVQVVLGQNKQQGVRVASRCLWDTDADNFASFTYKAVRVYKSQAALRGHRRRRRRDAAAGSVSPYLSLTSLPALPP